ncbi:MAG: hypothetical protein M1827_002146 [Pycnora praestabilis]|nr:MAG: hypothetical protein M1827_002146 [Pycnora praestabilis]
MASHHANGAPLAPTATGQSTLSTSGQRDPLAGHVNHLTPPQEKALGEFKKLCTSRGLYRAATHEGDEGVGVGEGNRASHDDGTLLRFLRARKFNVQDAYQQYSDTENWRESNQINVLYEKIDVQDYDETRRLYPQWLGRRDKRGIPLYLFEVSHLNHKTMAAYDKSSAKTAIPISTAKGASPAKLLRLFALYENLTRFIMPLCTAIPGRPNSETPITQSNNIVDISGVSMKQFWNLRSHMQDASTLATAHYPETLDRIFIIGAPSFFPTVWGWIKRWFDPITVSKIFILAHHEVKPTLLSYIDLENIPRQYGGTLDFKFGDLPNIEPAVQNILDWSTPEHTFPLGPVKWIHDEKDDRTAVAVGSMDGKERRMLVASLHPQGKARPSYEAHPQASVPVSDVSTQSKAPVNETSNPQGDVAVHEPYSQAKAPMHDVHSQGTAPSNEMPRHEMAPVNEGDQQGKALMNETYPEEKAPLHEAVSKGMAPITETHPQETAPVTEAIWHAMAPVQEITTQSQAPLDEVPWEGPSTVNETHPPGLTEEEIEAEFAKMSMPEEGSRVVQNGQVVSASRPEPVSFKTAVEGTDLHR